MGAWSEDIYGNDTALDTLGDLEALLDVDGLHPEEVEAASMKKARAAAASDAMQDKLLRLVRGLEDDPMECQRINGQVVCATLMRVGARISAPLRALGMECATDDYDAWQDPEARRRELEQFRRQLETYEEGKVVPRKTTGLFARLAGLMRGD